MILNPAQNKAVDSIEGPLMTIAGPGTGKTQLLSARVGSILEKTDLLPENILCLTFTDAASAAMRKRLIKFMSADAHRVPIFTFHSFCQKVITDYQNEMEILSLEPVSDLETIEFYNKIIDQFEFGNPLKNYKVPYTYRKDLKELNRLLKQEQLTKVTIEESIKKLIDELPSNESILYKRAYKGFKAGNINPTKYKEAYDKLEKLKFAIQACYDYRQLLSENGRYDFDDMIIWVIDFLKKNEHALVRYQEQYQYIMVDEYQDTNKAQNELMLLLASYWDSPNVMVVGDDDQSIYRFQGANVENLHDFENRFTHDLQKVVLSENYRSSQSILDAAGWVIHKNTTRLIADKKLESKNPEIKSNEPPLVVECTNLMYEAAFITNEILKAKAEGMPLSEMAVIYRNHAQVDVLKAYLGLKGIPYYLKKRTDILNIPFTTNIIELLYYIGDEKIKPYSGEHRLFKILHFDFWEIAPADLAKLAFYLKEEKLKWRDAINGIEENENLKKIISSESAVKIAKLASDIEYWIGKAFNFTLQQLLEKVIAKGGILSYVMQSSNKLYLLQALQTFFDYLKEETRKRTNLSLEGFLKTIKLMQDNSIALEAEEIIEKSEGVNLLTAHSSKGLEFEMVFVIGCNTKLWDKTKDRLPFHIREVIVPATSNSLLEENRRLFYVACTRAKSYLSIIYNTTDLDLKDQQESVFVTEFLESGIPQKIKAQITDEQIMEIQISLFGADTDDKDFEPIDKDFLNKFTDNYVLSATHLDNYLECPIKFYYRNLLQIPSAKTGPLTFGNGIHRALELFFKSMLKHPEKQYPGLDQLVSWFRFDMDRHADSFTPEDFSRTLEYGSEKVLPQLYNTFLPEWEENKHREPEKNLKDIVVNNVPIKGKLDQLVFQDNYSVNVIDFKTGKFSSEKKKTLKPPVIGIDPETAKMEERYGGNYWRQVAFYHLLINNDKFHNYKTISGEMFFVEPDAKGNFTREKIFIQPEEFKFMENLIADVYGKIKNHEFTKGCGKKDCEWCNFNMYYLNRQVYSSEGLMEEMAD
ncbi:MAG: ATP-dependent DNA helicase [Bacteroidia bacterium]